MQAKATTSFAGAFASEDHLIKLVHRTGPVAYKTQNNKRLPRPQHSAFGDFPASHMPKK